jgi:hypothetical protein
LITNQEEVIVNFEMTKKYFQQQTGGLFFFEVVIFSWQMVDAQQDEDVALRFL